MIQITQAALRSALWELRWHARRRETHAEAATFLMHGLQVLEALLAPTPDPAPCRNAEAPPSTQPAGAEAAAESTEDPPPPAEEGAQPAARTRGGNQRDPATWSDARKAALTEAWFTLPPLNQQQLAHRLNRLPGPELTGHRITIYAISKMKLPARRKPEWLAEAERRRAAAAAPGGGSNRDTSPESDAGQKPPPAPPPTARAPSTRRHGHHLPAQHTDEAEAKQMLRDGSSVRQVAEEFDLPMATVSLWQLQVRKEAETA